MTWLTLYVIILFAIPTTLVIDALGSAGAPSMLMGLLSFGGWGLLQLSVTSGSTTAFERRSVRTALIAFVICVGLGYISGMTRPIDGDEISPADVAMLSVVSWAGTALVTNDGIQSLERAKILARRLAWAGGALGLLGIGQFLTGQTLINWIAIPGLRAGVFEIFTRDGMVRPSGTATHPIEFGIILTMLLPLALHVAFTDLALKRWLRWLPVLVLGVAVSLTFSRSAYVSIAVAVVILVIGWPMRRRIAFLIGGVVLSVALFVAVPRLFGIINSLFRNIGNDPSISSRTDSYDLFWEFFVKWPFFGRGLGTFLPKYRIFDNEYLGLLIGVGIVGTIAFLALVGAAIISSLRVYREVADPALSDLGLTLIASIAAGAMSLTAFDAFAFPMTMGTLFLLLGLAGALRRLSSSAQGTPFHMTAMYAPQSKHGSWRDASLKGERVG
ncbi:O-antigen ligase family protein [Glutamicibacter protophormiae]|uniref:O-antigen ligase family protein n=1 Tax=Glutamicibacter protophormiae TaxID=37930 RepID=UPI003A9472E9